jgi:hypothetical protein
MSGGQFNYNKESSVNPVSYRNRDTVFTMTRDASLGLTMYEAADKNDLADSKADKAFFTTGFDDNKEDNGAGNIYLQIDVVRQDKLRALGAPLATGSIVGSQDSSSEDEDRQQAAIAPRSVLRGTKNLETCAGASPAPTKESTGRQQDISNTGNNTNPCRTGPAVTF